MSIETPSRMIAAGLFIPLGIATGDNPIVASRGIQAYDSSSTFDHAKGGFTGDPLGPGIYLIKTIEGVATLGTVTQFTQNQPVGALSESSIAIPYEPTGDDPTITDGFTTGVLFVDPDNIPTDPLAFSGTWFNYIEDQNLIAEAFL